MQEINILKVIEELGELLTSKDNKIKLQEYEIENLHKKIERIEEYIKILENKGA